MELNFIKDSRTGITNLVQIDDARIIFRNFSGLGDKYNREGDRNYAVVIPNEDLADALVNDKNEYGVGWNVKVKPPRDEDDTPFMFMKVKVSFGGRKQPAIYLKSGNNMRKLDENTIGILDRIDIQSVDMDVRPYDDTGNYGPFRSAYLQSMCVTQNIDRFSARFAEEEYPEE